MEWKGRRESDNVEDARSRSGGGGGGGGYGGGGGLGLLMTIGRLFGFKGIIAVLVIGGVAWQMGWVDPSMFLGGVPSSRQFSSSESVQDDERYHFGKAVITGTEEVWTKEFARVGKTYVFPK